MRGPWRWLLAAFAAALLALAATLPAAAAPPSFQGTQAQPIICLDTSGNWVSCGGTGGGGTAADQTGTNATDGQATSTANQHALAFGYIFNGTSWDRIRGTGGAVNTTDQNAAQTIATPGTAPSKVQGVQRGDGSPVAGDGTDNTGVTQPSSGAGIRGWLSAIYSKLAGILTTKIDQTTPGTTNKVSIGNDGQVAVGQYSSGLQTFGNGQIYFSGLDIRGHTKTSEAGSSDPLVGITSTVGASATSAVGKSSPGNLYRAYATATSAPASQQYLVCINATTAPTAGSAITAIDFAPFNLATTAGATASINFGPGPPAAYSTGITCLISTSLTTYAAGTASFINVAVR